MRHDLRVYTDDRGRVTNKEKHTGGKGDLSSFDPATDVIVAYTNEEVLKLNQRAAEQLGKSPELNIGDEVVIGSIGGVLSQSDYNQRAYPTCVSKGKLMEGAELSKAATKTTNEIIKFGTDMSGYTQYDITIDGEDYLIYGDDNHYANEKRLETEVKEMQFKMIAHHKIPDDVKVATWCRENRGEKYVRERGQAWSKYLAHKNLIFSIRRPYAFTVHKTQGSEYKRVFIAQSDIKKSIRNNYYETYARLMYVALSRAIEEVIIL